MKCAIAAVLIGLPVAGMAEGWQPVATDDAIHGALADETLIFDAYTRQDFGAAGDTQYITERLSNGRWAARDGQYCSVWPPSDVWTCYDLEINGDAVRFISADGAVSEGKYQK